MSATRLALFLTLLPALLSAEVLSVDAYRQRLARIDGLLRSGDWVGARAEAGKVARDRIAFGGEQIEPDLSILQPLAAAPNAEAAEAAAPRLSRLVAALSQVPAERTTPADAGLLRQVQTSEELAAIPKGGSLHRRDLGLAEALAELLEPIRRWIADAWEKFVKWLLGLFPEKEKSKGLFNLPPLILGLILLLAVAAVSLIWRALRRRRRRTEEPVPAGAAPAPPLADEDPLSRETSEWERYARELAAAGREREAIRAWYHAVLVSLFRRGLLHYRKGRTNWEYVSALAGHTWRASFIEMTRLFEREWYGRDRSSPEALEEAEGMALGLLDEVREAA